MFNYFNGNDTLVDAHINTNEQRLSDVFDNKSLIIDLLLDFDGLMINLTIKLGIVSLHALYTLVEHLFTDMKYIIIMQFLTNTWPNTHT